MRTAWLIGLLLWPVTAIAQDPGSRPTRPRPAAKKAEKVSKRKVRTKRQDRKSKPEKNPWLAIVGGDVHTAVGPVVRGGTVLVKDGKIVKVGRSVKVPAGARVIDARGRHVAPGFVATMSSGLFGGRSQGNEKLADSFDPFSLQMEMALAAGITSAHQGVASISPFAAFFGGGGAGLGGTTRGVLGGTVAKLTLGTIEGFEVKDPAGLYFTYAQNPPTRRAQTREVLEKARAYLAARAQWLQKVQKGDTKAKPPRLSSQVAPWIKVYDGELPAFTKAVKRTEIEALLELCDAFDLPVVLYGAEEAWIIPDEIGRRRVSLLIDTRGEGFNHFRYRQRPGKDLWTDGPGGWSLQTAFKVAAAGIPWASVTQSKTVDFDGIPGRDLVSLAQAAALAVRGGVTNEEALRSITIGAASILGVGDRIGSLEPGKDADILVMDREPLDYRSFVELAFVNGRLAYDKSKSRIWSHIRTDRSAGMGPWERYGIWSEWPDGLERLTGAPVRGVTRQVGGAEKAAASAGGASDG